MADAAGRSDPLGLQQVLGDRLLPVIVGSMAFLAALALGGALAAQALADRWRLGAGAALTAQVPRPDDPAAPDLGGAHLAGLDFGGGGGRGRLAAVSGPDPGVSRLERSLELLRASPAIVAAHPLSPGELDDLLKPWLGTAQAIPHDLLPAVVAVRAAAAPPGGEATFDQLAEALQAAVPGASLERHAAWAGRLSTLLRALQVCGWGALLLVAGVATLSIAAATRAGLVARRSTVDILHGLGATDGYVAARFARRAMALATVGGIAGTLLAVPVLVAIARLAGPFTDAAAGGSQELPTALWIGLAMLPLSAAGIGYLTAHGTVRLWLRRLP